MTLAILLLACLVLAAAVGVLGAAAAGSVTGVRALETLPSSVDRVSVTALPAFLDQRHRGSAFLDQRAVGRGGRAATVTRPQ